MAAKRPTVVLVMGILNIIFGAFGLAGSLCSGVVLGGMAFVPTPPGVPGMEPGTPMINIFNDAAAQRPGCLCRSGSDARIGPGLL
jgi:hypothetical protein